MKEKKDTRAVSEVVAYVIILGIVFTVFSLIFFNATSIFSAAGDTEKLENGQRGLEILQLNAEKIVFGEAPRRTVDFPLSGGTISVGEAESRVVLRVNGTEVRNGSVSSVRYSLNNGLLVYENGAVISNSTGGSGMVSDPGWVVREDSVRVHGVRTFGGGAKQSSGSATVKMEAAGSTFTETVSRGESENVSIEIISPNSPAWAQYADELEDRETVTNFTRPARNSVEINMNITSDQTFVYVGKQVRVRVR